MSRRRHQSWLRAVSLANEARRLEREAATVDDLRRASDVMAEAGAAWRAFRGSTDPLCGIPR